MPWASHRHALALVSCFLQCSCVRKLCGAGSRATSAHAPPTYCCPTLSTWLKPSPQAPWAAHPAASIRSASQPPRARPGCSKPRVCQRRQWCLARSGKALGRHPLRAHTARGLTMSHCPS
ncbi:hypothetical protein K438DRAFT_1882830 [Mycena galopus ATCC 62051]|nr:hypothetical protein K438DRAFT_1882830 [Mycena galopus ATCC 62051]